MKWLVFAGFVFFAAFSGPIVAQSAVGPTGEARPVFVIADVHSSPYSMYPYMRATSQGDRYVIRQATMVDLIARAYGVDPRNVEGGPSWLEADRFDIYAKTPGRASSEAARLMLRALLADRFKLVLHSGTKQLPAFVLIVGKGGPKLTEADGSADPNCLYIQPPSNPPAGTEPLHTFSCRNTSMQALAENLHEWAGDYLTDPVVDSTGLKGGWDFEIKFHSKNRVARAGASGVSVFDAIDKQLGLKLEAKTAPLPVLVVDSVNERPTPNSPDFAKILPPPPPPEFEVATVRPSTPDETMNARIDGGQASLQAGTLKQMIAYGYSITDEMMVGAPKWVETDHFDVLAKVFNENPNGQPGVAPIYPDDLRLMMRKLLQDRFKLVAHMEDRPLEAYILIAANPKLKLADPANRTGCKEGPGADGKDPRITTPILGRLLTCRNMTMMQFAAMLQSQAGGYIHTPVLDATGIEGSYDFTLSFSSSEQLQSGGGGAASGDVPGASDPSGGLSLADAINKQLGLRLVKQRRPVPVLVIDHIEEKPTEN